MTEMNPHPNATPSLHAVSPLKFNPTAAATPHLLLSSLSPIRLAFHPFLSEITAARLMCVSRLTVTSLLHDYTFHQHVFQPTDTTADSLQRLTQMYSRFGMRVTRLSLHPDFNCPLLDSAGRSLLPSSLVTLVLGHVHRLGRGLPSLFDCDLTADEEVKTTPFDPATFDLSWRIKRYTDADGHYNQHLSPGALPEGLRHLQLTSVYTQPLLPGSIPSTVTLLVLGYGYNHPLRGVLPASLTRLQLGDKCQQPLLPGDLPPSLEQLHCGYHYNEALKCGSLPAGLKALQLGTRFNCPLSPGVLPSSLTHLRLSEHYDQPLQPGSLPEGLHHLTFSHIWRGHSLTPGILPSSLRQLNLPLAYPFPLPPNCLPPHLHSLRLPLLGHRAPLAAANLPATLRVLDCGIKYGQPIEEGALPNGLRWLAVPVKYQGKIEHVLPEGCDVHWLSNNGKAAALVF